MEKLAQVQLSGIGKQFSPLFLSFENLDPNSFTVIKASKYLSLLLGQSLANNRLQYLLVNCDHPNKVSKSTHSFGKTAEKAQTVQHPLNDHASSGNNRSGTVSLKKKI